MIQCKTSKEIGGMGHSVRRKEDVRFIQGKGRYIDDIKLPGPSPHHPIGAKGVGESPTVGAPPAIVNAVVDALSHLGVTHLEIPITAPKLWKILKERGVA